MTAALSPSYLEIAEAKSAEDFRGQIIQFANELGFCYVSAMTVIDHPAGRSDFISIDNMPQTWRDSGGSSGQSRDPVMQHCKHRALPIIWDQGTYLRQGSVDLWEEQAVFGYRTGIALALHLPEGRHFMLSVDRDQPLGQPAQELTRMVADLHLFAVHAQEAALRLFVTAEPLRDTPSLTPREKEVLCWVLEGKTAWESGRILSISEAAVNKHIQSTLRKLGATNKHQAAIKARRLGLTS